MIQGEAGWESKFIRTSTHLGTPPAFVPVPTLDCHIITPRQNQTQRRMDRQTPYIVWMSFERGNLFASRDVIYAQLKVVRARDELQQKSVDQHSVPEKNDTTQNDIARRSPCNDTDTRWLAMPL